tara:strand:+ start:1552 stop:2586 length:1035 start_codon:yes stop_codon:yes gene_type:complete
MFKEISKDKKSNFFLIAEIGNNHQGDINAAKKLIEQAKISGAHAVKFQKRFNKKLFTDEMYNSSYENENSFGKTYGKHRDFLEFGLNEYKILKKFAEKLKIVFFATPFDFESVDFLNKVKVPAFKIASGDLTNLPLQEKVAKTKKPIFLSTGGGAIKDIDRAIKNILKFNKKLCVMHCTAAYPAQENMMNLNFIKTLKKKYPKITIGLSDHYSGILSSTVAFLNGALVFEKHFTLNRSNKGTDHAFSLEPTGLRKLRNYLDRINILQGRYKKKVFKEEKKPIIKMSKSIVTSRKIKIDEKLTLSNLELRSPGGGLPPYEIKKILNKRVKKEFKKHENIRKKFIY